MLYSWAVQPAGQIIPSPSCFLLNGILYVIPVLFDLASTMIIFPVLSLGLGLHSFRSVSRSAGIDESTRVAPLHKWHLK